jgi:hypothetical protein
VLHKPYPTPDQFASRWDEIVAICEQTHPGESRLLGEDHHFCRLARKAGFKLWTDMNAVIGHIGDAIYPIGPEQLSSAACIPSSESFFEHTD